MSHPANPLRNMNARSDANARQSPAMEASASIKEESPEAKPDIDQASAPSLTNAGPHLVPDVTPGKRYRFHDATGRNITAFENSSAQMSLVLQRDDTENSVWCCVRQSGWLLFENRATRTKLCHDVTQTGAVVLFPARVLHVRRQWASHFVTTRATQDSSILNFMYQDAKAHTYELWTIGTRSEGDAQVLTVGLQVQAAFWRFEEIHELKGKRVRPVTPERPPRARVAPSSSNVAVVGLDDDSVIFSTSPKTPARRRVKNWFKWSPRKRRREQGEDGERS